MSRVPSRPALPGRRPLGLLLALVLALAGLTATAFPAAADARGPITPGTQTTVNLAAGESATYTFTGVAARHITLLVQSPSPLSADITGPDGVVLPGLLVGGFTGPYDDTALITRAGAWSVTFRSWSGDAVSAQVTLGLVADRTASLTLGTPTTRTIAVPGEDHRLTFQGTAGKRLVVRLTANDLTPPPGSPYSNTVVYSLVRPGSTTPEYIGSANTIPAYIEVPELAASGSYALVLESTYGATGAITFGVHQPTDVTGTIAPGTAKTVAVQTPGQRTSLTFTGVVGARVTLRTSSTGELSGAGPQIALLRPGSSDPELLFGGAFIEGPLIEQAGTYTLLVGPSALGTTGTITLTLALPTDIRRTVTPGTATPLTIASPGQNARLALTVQQGQKVTLRVANPNWTETGPAGPERGRVRYNLTNAAGDQSFSFEISEQEAGTAVSPSLPNGGQWFVGVDPIGDTTGSATLTLGTGRARTASLTVGQPATAQLALGDTLTYSFAGVAGRRINFSVTAATWTPAWGSVNFSLIAPDGSEYRQQLVGGAPFYTETFEPLPQSGTWKLRLDPQGQTSGSQTVVVRQPTDVRGTITSGASRTVTLGTPGQRAIYTFTGAVGQRAVVEVTGQSWRSVMNGGAAGSGSATLTFVRPDGEVLGSPVGLGSEQRAVGESLPLDVAGTWTAIVDPESDAVGSLTATPRLLRDTDGGTLASGASKSVNLPTIGQRIRYSVSAKAGDSVALEVTRAAWTSATRSPATVNATLSPPAGSSAQPKRFTISDLGQEPIWLGPDFGSVLIEETGTWTLELDPEYDTVGSQTFALHVRTPVTGQLAAGQAKKITLSQKGQDAVFTLPTQAGVEYRYAITGSTFAAARFGRVWFGDTLYEPFQIPAGASDGTLGQGDGEPWQIRFDPSEAATGSLTITVTAVPAA